MVDNEFLFFQVIPVLFNCSQHWLKFFLFSELSLVKVFTVYMSAPESDQVHLEMSLQSYSKALLIVLMIVLD